MARPIDDERLADWVDGRLGERERERFEAEMRVNPDLRAAAEEYRAFTEQFRGALASIDEAPGPDLTDRIMQTVAAPRGPRIAPWLGSLLAAAALALIYLAITYLPSDTDEPTVDGLASDKVFADAELDGRFESLDAKALRVVKSAMSEADAAAGLDAAEADRILLALKARHHELEQPSASEQRALSAGEVAASEAELAKLEEQIATLETAREILYAKRKKLAETGVAQSQDGGPPVPGAGEPTRETPPTAGPAGAAKPDTAIRSEQVRDRVVEEAETGLPEGAVGQTLADERLLADLGRHEQSKSTSPQIQARNPQTSIDGSPSGDTDTAGGRQVIRTMTVVPGQAPGTAGAAGMDGETLPVVVFTIPTEVIVGRLADEAPGDADEEQKAFRSRSNERLRRTSPELQGDPEANSPELQSGWVLQSQLLAQEPVDQLRAAMSNSLPPQVRYRLEIEDSVTRSALDEFFMGSGRNKPIGSSEGGARQEVAPTSESTSDGSAPRGGVGGGGGAKPSRPTGPVAGGPGSGGPGSGGPATGGPGTAGLAGPGGSAGPGGVPGSPGTSGPSTPGSGAADRDSRAANTESLRGRAAVGGFDAETPEFVEMPGDQVFELRGDADQIGAYLSRLADLAATQRAEILTRRAQVAAVDSMAGFRFVDLNVALQLNTVTRSGRAGEADEDAERTVASRLERNAVEPDPADRPSAQADTPATIRRVLVVLRQGAAEAERRAGSPAQRR